MDITEFNPWWETGSFVLYLVLKKGYLINREEDKIMEIKGKKIIIIPITKFFTF